MSQQSGQPPTPVPGYEPERLLGAGAYGEVWVAVEQNTGRRVAIKFYAHRGGLDWSLLSREVEKLAFLFADRYVVQLIGVGWNAEPPYYVMEYLEQGSLAKRLEHGPLPVVEAVEIFRDVAVGLVHAHGKGVLHCDLKPGNVLLDQDNKPRLADFGQSRLSHEQAPALGTLFYMAPEQADLDAVPDARWDVYALGSLLCCMLTGRPAHQSDEVVRRLEQAGNLVERLAVYRRTIRKSPTPTAHRQVSGVDHALAVIVDRCLAVDPQERFPNVQAVLDALDARTTRRARRPMMLLGAIGPALVLLVVSWFAWQGFSAAIEQSDCALTERALESNQYAARFVARVAGEELDRRYRAVERVASSEQLRKVLTEAAEQPNLRRLLKQLSDPKFAEEELTDERQEELAKLRKEFVDHPSRLAVQKELAALADAARWPKAAGWFVTDASGVQVARAPEGPTLGKNFAWRTYFHGGPQDVPETQRPEEHITHTTLSAVFLSRADNRWKVAISTPVISNQADGAFLGVAAMMVDLGGFVELQGGEQQFAVLVDMREGDKKGVILQHPLFKQFEAGRQGKLPDRFKNYRVTPEDLSSSHFGMQPYRDPLARDPDGKKYDKLWLAQTAPVSVRHKNTGLAVIVQQAYDSAIGSTLAQLRAGLVRFGVAALLMIALVMMGLWGLAIRLLNDGNPPRSHGSSGGPTEGSGKPMTPNGSTDTLPMRKES